MQRRKRIESEEKKVSTSNTAWNFPINQQRPPPVRTQTTPPSPTQTSSTRTSPTPSPTKKNEVIDLDSIFGSIEKKEAKLKPKLNVDLDSLFGPRKSKE